MKKLLVVLWVVIAATVSAQTPTIKSVKYNAWKKVAQAPIDTARWMFFPVAYSFDVLNAGSIIKKTFVGWSIGEDAPGASIKYGWMASLNEAVTFNVPGPTNTTGINALSLICLTKRNTDGNMIAMPFKLDQSGWSTNVIAPININYFTSSDNGETWNRHTDGVFTGFPAAKAAGVHFHDGPLIQDADGTLYAPASCRFRFSDGTTDPFQRTILVKSTDGGKTWIYVSTIAASQTYLYSEHTIARCKDNSILDIYRVTTTNPYETYRLNYRRSIDNGLTWGAPALVPNLPSTNGGVGPMLHMMPNGILVLTYGDEYADNKRNNVIAYSPSGNGDSWKFIHNAFTSTSTGGSGNNSTGYGNAVSLKNNRIMLFSDRGLHKFYPTAYPSPNPYSIWSSTIDVVTDYRNRIDLKSMYLMGSISVSTDLNYTSAAHPEAGVMGAFDGSTDYWSGAFNMNSGSHYYKVDLKDTAIINGISICLLKGVSQSADIEYSLDGSTWTLIKSYSSVVHQTVDYTSFSPVSVRYVRVKFNSAPDKVGITELNIFRTADTFEDYSINAIPQDYVAPNGGVWTTNSNGGSAAGNKSQCAMYFVDNTATAHITVEKAIPSSSKKTFIFDIKPKAYAPTNAALQFVLKSGTNAVFHMAVFRTGVIKYYDGTWKNVGSGPVSVPIDTWSTIKVVADAIANTASVYVNGVLIGSNVTKETASANSINGFAFTGGGTASAGDQALFDNVDCFTTTTDLIESNNSAILMPSLIKKDTTKPLTVIISPNPVDATAKLIIENIKQGKLDVYIMNVYGRTIKKFGYITEGNTYTTDLPVQDLPIGVYIIAVQQNGVITQTKIVK